MSGSDKQIQHCRSSETAAVYVGRPARNGKPGMPCTAKCNRIRYRTVGNGKRAFPAMLQSRRLSRVKPGARYAESQAVHSHSPTTYPFFRHGEAKTASAGSTSRVPAADIEDIVIKSIKEHLAARQDKSTRNAVRLEDRDLTQLITEIVVQNDRLIIRLKSDHADEASDAPENQSLTIPWKKPPSKKSRQIPGGWMMLSQVKSPLSPSFALARNAAFGSST
jgi:hypothetical protein